jgi:hypothetical protein
MHKQIRLTIEEINSIKHFFTKNFDHNDHLWIFGSRVNPIQRGGDIDLYIESNNSSISTVLDQKIQFLIDLKNTIGEQQIDVIINIKSLNKNLSIYKEAKNSGIMLI